MLMISLEKEYDILSHTACMIILINVLFHFTINILTRESHVVDCNKSFKAHVLRL